MLEITVDPKSFGIIRRESNRFRLRLRAASNKAVYRGASELYRSVLDNMSRADYSLRELQQKNHPYARKHGTILTGKLGMPFTMKPYLIHQRSGKLKKDLNITLNRSSSTAKVSFGGSLPYTDAVIFGTKVSKMLPRDVISGTASEKKVRREIRKEMLIPLRAVIKSYGG